MKSRFLPHAISLLSICSSSSFLVAEPSYEALFFDQPIAEELKLQYEEAEKERPQRSEFQIVDSAFLSNEIGERWALVTIHNLSSENRTFDEDQIAGILANGTIRKPLSIKRIVRGRDSQSVMLNFGPSKYPLVRVYTRNQ